MEYGETYSSVLVLLPVMTGWLAGFVLLRSVRVSESMGNRQKTTEVGQEPESFIILNRSEYYCIQFVLVSLSRYARFGKS